MEWSGRDEGDNGATLMLYTSKGKKKGIRTRPVGNTGTRKRRQNNKTRHTKVRGIETTRREIVHLYQVRKPGTKRRKREIEWGIGNEAGKGEDKALAGGWWKRVGRRRVHNKNRKRSIIRRSQIERLVIESALDIRGVNGMGGVVGGTSSGGESMNAGGGRSSLWPAGSSFGGIAGMTLNLLVAVHGGGDNEVISGANCCVGGGEGGSGCDLLE